MRARSLSDVARAVNGTVRTGEDPVVSSVVTDSRVAEPGSLFVALLGEHRDGHAYVADAIARGAVAAIVDRPLDVSSIVVEDTGAALLALAADERRRATDVRVVGITGANGKTSTKDLAVAVLGTRFRVHGSPASFNNEIGLPLTLLGAPADAEVVVAELGARRVGDVSLLCEVARPDVVVVTNLGVAHMEIFGSWDAIVASGAEAVDALGAAGTAILNADDPVVRGFVGRGGSRTITFGLAPEADIRAEELELDRGGRACFVLSNRDGREPVCLAVPGEHMVPNALAAAACGAALGVSAGESAAALKGARVSRWRMETFTNADGVVVVNDAYNANPESMAAALKAARSIARGGRLGAVLGHMAELGPIAAEEHDRLGTLIVRVGVDHLITVGEAAAAIARAAVREGQPPGDAASYGTVDEAVDEVRGWAREGDVVLVKGSRVVGLERVAEALR